MTVTVVATGLDLFGKYVEQLPDIARQAARIAINDVAAGEGRKTIKDEISRQVAFPSGYLNEDRLTLKKRARDNDLEAVIEGRQRPTSLARFSSGGAIGVRGPISVRVKPGASRRMNSAFLVRLRAGASLTQDNFNIGLAVRLKPGQQVFNKTKMSAVQLDHNVYILYGPSVDQVFRTVSEDVSPILGEQLENEFLRQFVRLSGGF